MNFDDISINLAEFYVSEYTTFRNGSVILQQPPNFLHELPRVTYFGFFGTSRLLFSINGAQTAHGGGGGGLAKSFVPKENAADK